jgi:hypothetical protein
MKKLVMVLAVGTALSAAPANAAVILVSGDNSLTTQIHADPDKPSTNTTVFGLTKPGNVGVSFKSDAVLNITGGKGYAQISDADVLTGGDLDNLEVFLTDGGGFTGYEFTIQFADLSRTDFADLTIGYELLSGATGSFSYAAGPNVFGDLRFTNSASRDFRLATTDGDVLQSVFLTSTRAFDQYKQNDIELAVAAVPEPATWAMMLGGFGLVGGAMRSARRRKTQVTYATA